MKKSEIKGQVALFEVLPNIFVSGQRKVVPIELVPSIHKIYQSKCEEKHTTDSVYPPARTVYVTENQNGTYATLNELATIRPELSRIRSTHIDVVVLDLSSEDLGDEDIDAIRTFPLYVDPYRHVGRDSEIAKLAYEGVFDSLAREYASPKSTPGKYTATSPLFLPDQLAKSTFDRVQAELREPSKKTRRKADNQQRKRLKKKKTKKKKRTNGRQKELFKK
jgi:hypothetical protein